MRAGVYPNAGVWQAMAAETVFVPDGIEVLLRAACAVQRDCVLAALCVRQKPCSRVCKARGCRGRVCAGTEGQLLFLLPG